MVILTRLPKATRGASARFLSLLVPLGLLVGCMKPMDLTAHMTAGDVTFTGTLDVAKSGDGRLSFSAPDGPNCDGIVVASTVRTPERLEGQIQCDDGRSGAIRMTISANQAVGSGRLGRDNISFRAHVRAQVHKSEQDDTLNPE